MTQLADEILIAYADGELNPEQCHLVEGVMGSDPLTRERLERQLVLNERLSQAFSLMLEAQARQAAVEQMSAGLAIAGPSDEKAPPHQTARSGKKGVVLTAAALLLSAGAIGGYLAAGLGSEGPGRPSDPFAKEAFWQSKQTRLEEQRALALRRKLAEVPKTQIPNITAATNTQRPSPQGHWYEAVAARHKQDAARLIDRYKGKSHNPELALFQLAGHAAAPARIPALQDEQLLFIGASLERIAGEDYACLIYRDRKNGSVPVGLYVSRNKGGSLTLERGYRGEDNYVRWTQGAHSYMLIGPVPHWRLIVISVAVQRKIVQ